MSTLYVLIACGGEGDPSWPCAYYTSEPEARDACVFGNAVLKECSVAAGRAREQCGSYSDASGYPEVMRPHWDAQAIALSNLNIPRERISDMWSFEVIAVNPGKRIPEVQ